MNLAGDWCFLEDPSPRQEAYTRFREVVAWFVARRNGEGLLPTLCRGEVCSLPLPEAKAVGCTLESMTLVQELVSPAIDADDPPDARTVRIGD